MWSMTSSTTVSHREVSLQTTFMLLDSIAIAPTSAGNKPENHIPALLTLLAKTVADPESLTVRTWSVRALGKLAEYVEPGEQYEIVSPALDRFAQVRGVALPLSRSFAVCTPGHDPLSCPGPPAGARGQRRAGGQVHLRVLRHRQPFCESRPGSEVSNVFTRLIRAQCRNAPSSPRISRA